MTCQTGLAKTLQTVHETFSVKHDQKLSFFFLNIPNCLLPHSSDSLVTSLSDLLMSLKNWHRSKFCPSSPHSFAFSLSLPMLLFSFGSQFANTKPQYQRARYKNSNHRTLWKKEIGERNFFWQRCTLVILRRGVTECLKRPQSRLPFSERYYSP